MTDNRVLLLADTDVVLYSDGAQEALHGAFTRAYELAKQQVGAIGRERTDAEGEIHRRRWRLVFGEDVGDITAKQRGFLHVAVFPQIAEQVRFPDGTRYTAKAFKELYREMFLGDRWVMRKKLVLDKATGKMRPAKRATPHRERISTEDLGIRGYSEHIDKVIAHAVTEFSVVFRFDADEREAVRYVRPKRKAKAAQAAQEEAVPA
jgi:hypothetical protein